MSKPTNEETAKALQNFFALVDMIAPEVKEIVAMIEAKPRTTQNRYGDYMASIMQVSKGNHCLATAIALAMVKAGGNRAGIMSALSVLYPANTFMVDGDETCTYHS